MKSSPSAEYRILREYFASINRPNRRRNILTRLPVDRFLDPTAREIRQRIERLAAAGKPIGDLASMALDPTLSKDARTVLSAEHTPLDKATVATLIRNVRGQAGVAKALNILHAAAAAGSVVASDEGRASLATELETGAKALRETLDDTLEVRTYGSNLDWAALATKITTPDPRAIITTGIPGLDDIISGWRRSDLILISANPGGCKSMLAMNAAWAQAKAGLSVAFFSLEMDADSIEERLISHVTRRQHSLIRNHYVVVEEERRESLCQDYARKLASVMTISGKLDIIRPRGHYPPAALSRDIDGKGYDVVYVDYITRMIPAGEDTWKLQMTYANDLKSLAGQHDVAMVVMTQLNDDGKVKYGSAPEEAADYWLKWHLGPEERERKLIEVNLAKARNAVAYKFPLALRMDIMTVEKPGTEENKKWNAGNV